MSTCVEILVLYINEFVNWRLTVVKTVERLRYSSAYSSEGQVDIASEGQSKPGQTETKAHSQYAYLCILMCLYDVIRLITVPNDKNTRQRMAKIPRGCSRPSLFTLYASEQTSRLFRLTD